MGECTHGFWYSAELGSNPDCAFLWLLGWQHAVVLCYAWVSSLAKGHCHGPDLVAWPRALRVVFQQLLGLQKGLHEYRWPWSSASSPGLELGSHVGSVPGPQACLLCSLLPQGKVRVVVFMGLGTRQALALGGSYLVPSP